MKYIQICGLAMMIACRQTPPSENPISDSLSSVESENQYLSIQALQDSINLYRNKAFDSERIKLESGAELLKEIAQTIPHYPIAIWQEAESNLNAMRNALYDSVSMGNEAVMDTYDKKTADFISSIDKLVNNTPDFKKYARAVLIYEEIKMFDNMDFSIRKEYNQYAIQYNELLRNGKIKGEKVLLFWGEPSI